MTDFQPTLPAEIPFTEAEKAFMEEEPPGFFPQNQDSNFGYIIRKVWCDRTQELIDQLTSIFQERFIATSTLFLDDWEEELGLPTAPTGASDATRRASALSRLQTGPFTKELRDSTITHYVSAAIGGSPILFSPEGVPFVAGGIPFGSEVTSVADTFKVVENLATFSYTVYILNTIAPDTNGLTRELTRITPAGISFSISFVAVLP